ncbi:hypothetical protein NE237_017329 [Protea cynaroides]|uniref:Uncharacterized protein n=1 Tax=Protea cynaroides TaxID=273540 RepID=A0A9Q0K7W0_9MAGN|nr:hypothetical protein NE237_017329 [Protea cynaroides]
MVSPPDSTRLLQLELSVDRERSSIVLNLELIKLFQDYASFAIVKALMDGLKWRTTLRSLITTDPDSFSVLILQVENSHGRLISIWTGKQEEKQAIGIDGDDENNKREIPKTLMHLRMLSNSPPCKCVAAMKHRDFDLSVFNVRDSSDLLTILDPLSHRSKASFISFRDSLMADSSLFDNMSLLNIKYWFVSAL